MDPQQTGGQPFPGYMPLAGFVPGIFGTYGDGDDLLSSLDSDTRAYVMNNTEEPRSRQDIEDCLRNLHTGK